MPYVLSIEDTISTAWKKVKGTKGSIWAAIGIIMLFSIGFLILEAVTKSIFPQLEPIVYFIGQVIMSLMQIGILYIGIRRAFDLSFSWDMIFHVFEPRMALYIIVLYILQTLLMIPSAALFIGGLAISASQVSGAGFITVGLFTLGIIIAIYLMVRVFIAVGFVIDKEFNPWKALKSSFAATRGNFWQLLGILIFQMIVMFLSVIPLLGIGFIWSFPFIMILFGEIYKRLQVNV